MKIDPNAPAYPLYGFESQTDPQGFLATDSEGNRVWVHGGSPGLSIRAEFAKAAMRGILSNPNWNPSVIASEHRTARSAVLYADALIAELNKEPDDA